MSTVFVGGSRRASRLNGKVKARLDAICEQDMTVIVGDANGADKAVQTYLAQRRYGNVIVYCSNGVCRNNIGHWTLRSVPTDAAPGTRSFYEAKDGAMAHDASYGLMIWDGRSKGTLNNVVALLRGGKSVLVYTTPDAAFQTFADPSQLERFLRDRGQPDMMLSQANDVPEPILFERTRDACAGDHEE